ncbi:alpha/beta-hydrolase [Annulohypoxylon maeteangense]|uniref:alpha/beta-hydrolase n=1 Tax=Annulohypoxylon maeteangense TaxID=1927788 RepID=UPI00200759C3|nr:alpha/beta-hydrolase [Annulohypoxylon maeteangense]KAI0886925.1 alpha/beta-hydrolase [Annulohypoxylon maeteangense]
MDSLQHKTLKTSRGFTYSYYVSNPTNSKQTLLLQHGFPDDAHLWDGIVRKLTEYRLVVPDLLGYSGTSKPTDAAPYIYSGIVQDVVDILDAEGIGKVISVGHDFGSLVAQRLYNHHPERVEGLILLNVGYALPRDSLPNLQEINDYLTKVLGYPIIAYQEFFVTDEAPVLMKAHVDRFYQAIHGAPVDWTKELWCARGKLRDWLLNDKSEVELIDYAQDSKFRQAFLDRFQRDGFEGPLCYYKASNSSVHYEDDKLIGQSSLLVKVPVLFIACTRDPVCRPEIMQPAKEKGLLPDLEEAAVDSRHWSPYEKPDEIAALIVPFLERRFTSK